MPGTGTPPDIPLFDLRLTPGDVEAVAEVLRCGWLTMGPRTCAFEERFAAHLGCRHAVAVSSGTAALHLAYLAAGVGPGDEVIVPSFSFVATAAAVRHCGATPVFADVVGLDDPSLDPEDAAARITPRTRAIACTHFAGYAAPVARLRALCDAHGLALIEDAAHAPATRIGDRAAGTFGLAGAFSFFSNKVLSAGEGGLLATDDDDVAASARLRRSHAMTSGTWDRHHGHADSYDVVDVGFNHRLDEPRAALLASRMDRLEDELARRRALTRAYRERLRDVPGVRLPFTDADVARSSCYVMPIMLEDPERQVPLRRALRERHGIQTSLLYPPAHRFTAYGGADAPALPRTELASRSEVTLPLFAHLTDEQLERVVAAVAAER